MFEKDLLSGKVILVTGGGTGLGRSMGERFLELGAKLAIASRNVERLEKAADEMSAASGGEVLPVACDVRDPDSVDAMVSAVFAHYGKVDVLLNNAAGNFVSPTERLSHRNTPAKPPSNGTTALLKTLLEFAVASLWMIGFSE